MGADVIRDKGLEFMQDKLALIENSNNADNPSNNADNHMSVCVTYSSNE